MWKRSNRRKTVSYSDPHAPAPPHSLRPIATHLLESGSDIRTVQQLLGDQEVPATLIHGVLNRGRLGVGSPASL